MNKPKEPANIGARYKRRNARLPTFKKVLNELKPKEGRQGELISLYIAQGTDIGKKLRQIRKEQATALNIKDKATRKNVIDALEKIILCLNTHYTKTPLKGLALFCGNVSEKNGHQDIRLWKVDDPPKPILVNSLSCDRVFKTELLDEMLRPRVVALRVRYAGKLTLYVYVNRDLLGDITENCYKAVEGSENYFPEFDVDKDGMIDWPDLKWLSDHLGERVLEVTLDKTDLKILCTIQKNYSWKEILGLGEYGKRWQARIAEELNLPCEKVFAKIKKMKKLGIIRMRSTPRQGGDLFPVPVVMYTDELWADNGFRQTTKDSLAMRKRKREC